MSGWQPIETAPKDGTQILVFTVHGEIELSSWFTVANYQYEHIEDDVYRRLNFPLSSWNSNNPTHWMPLPDPPEAT